MKIKKPQKAPSDPISDYDLRNIIYPIVGSPKLDGFRCIVDEGPKTSSMKSWPNEHIRNVLSDPRYHGLDGEIIVGSPNDPNVFHNTSGPVRRIQGKPDFRFYVFDNWTQGNYSYKERWVDTVNEFADDPVIYVLEQRLLNTPEEVLAYEAEMLRTGFEGAMIRSLSGRYKEGRCSFREMNIFKRKPFVECEAVITGFIEGMQNLNESHVDEMGRNVRSSHAANKVPKGTLGSWELKSDLWPAKFTAAMGEGWNDDMKLDLWNHRQEYIGQIATVKYQKYGSRDAPRIPSVIKIRPNWDLERFN
jgi:DNA ligase-1